MLVGVGGFHSTALSIWSIEMVVVRMHQGDLFAYGQFYASARYIAIYRIWLCKF
jgi:hypothetical protein